MPIVTLEHNAINEAQRGFLESGAARLLFSGAFGAGKSVALCAKALKLSLDYPHNFGLLCRKVRATLAQTTLKTFLDLVCPPELIREYNKTEGLITLDNGSQVLFGGLDDPLKLGSLNLGWAGIDEAIETNEDDWKMLEGRLRLPNVPHQIFAATNPGPPSHYLYRLFFQDRRGEVYQASSLENPELPEDYRARLAEFEGTYYERYVLGQWVGMEGLVYAAFDEKVCLIPRFEIPKRWLNYTGHDFGLANPAALFYAQDPDTGNFYLWHEYLPGGGYGIYDHVQEFKRVTEGVNVIKRVGGSHQEDEIRQGYTAQGWPIAEPKYSRDRKYQIEKVQGMHRLNKVFVFNDLPSYLREKLSFAYRKDGEAFTELIEEEAKFHLMACLVAGTAIVTDCGERAIQHIKRGDKVLTRQGYFPVCDTLRKDAEIVEARFSDGSVLKGTPDHRVFVKAKGWVNLAALRYGDIMETWKEKRLSSTGLLTTDILKAEAKLAACTSLIKDTIYIGQFGNLLTAQYQKVGTFITKMATRLTIILRTLNLSLRTDMRVYITRGIVVLLNLSTCGGYSPLQPLVGSNGQQHLKGRRLLASVLKSSGPTESLLSRPASDAGENTKHSNHHIAGFVHRIAKLLRDGRAALMMKGGYVLHAAKPSSSVGIAEPDHALDNVVRCLGVSPAGRAPVYDLNIQSVHEYYANGILVHNCERYILSDFAPETVPQQEKAPAWRY